jgi:hypothetical protein
VCDFVIANPQTGEISEPRQITKEDVPPGALPIVQDNRELLESYKFGENECGLSKYASSQAGVNPAVPGVLIAGSVVVLGVAIATSRDENDREITPRP